LTVVGANDIAPTDRRSGRGVRDVAAASSIVRPGVHGTAEGSDSPYYLVGELVFDDIEALQAGASSPEGQAAATNFAELAPPGSLLLVVEETLDRPF
jgi:uncharacterized protein (TIGR02118 family)